MQTLSASPTRTNAMRIQLVPCAAILAAMLLPACNREAADNAATAPAPAVAPASAIVPAPVPIEPGDEITMRYACDRDVGVLVMRSGRATAQLPDGTIARLSHIADSTPPVFTGDGLYFRVGEERAFLSQEEGTELACQPE